MTRKTSRAVAPDAAVRAAAAALAEVVQAAERAGYVVSLPFPVSALDRIAISETAKVKR